MKKSETISIVIPAFNAERTIVDSVAAAGEQRWAGERPEVIVVDDGSTDSTAAVAERAGARVIRQDNAGPAAARNRGWRESTGDLVFFTDSDCFPHSDWISRLTALLDDEKCGAAGGSYAAANQEEILAACIQEEIAARHRRMRRKVRFLGSFNLAVKRSVLEELGGFHTEYRRASGEDNEFSYRMRKAGYNLLFDREALVAHVHPTHLVPYLKEQLRHGYWRMRLYKDHPEQMSGDDYSGGFDFLEPPAALLLLGLIPLLSLPFVPRLFRLVLLFLIAVAAWPTLLMVRRRNSMQYLYFLPVRFLRSFARGIGMAAGIWQFWILRRGGA